MRNKQHQRQHSQKTEIEILSRNVKLIPKAPKYKMTTTSVSIPEKLLHEFNYIVNKKYGFGNNTEKNNERAGRRRGTKSSSAVIAELVEKYVLENKKLLHDFITDTTTVEPSEPEQVQVSQQ